MAEVADISEQTSTALAETGHDPAMSTSRSTSGQDEPSEDTTRRISRLDLNLQFEADHASLSTINEDEEEQDPSMQDPSRSPAEDSHWSDSDTAESAHAEYQDSEHSAGPVDMERSAGRESDSDRSSATATTQSLQERDGVAAVVVSVEDVAQQEPEEGEHVESAPACGEATVDAQTKQPGSSAAGPANDGIGESSTSANVQDTVNEDTPRRSVRFILPPEETHEAESVTGQSTTPATPSEHPLPDSASNSKGKSPVQSIEAEPIAPSSSRQSTSRTYDASELAVPGKNRVLPSGPGWQRGIGAFGTRPPFVYDRIPHRTEVEGWHWCTHTTLIRKFVAEDNELDKCSVCLMHPSQGWLYECTEDRTDDRWRDGNDFLASWMADAIKDGVYDDEAVAELIRQKLAVREEAYKQKYPPPPAIRRTVETTAGIHAGGVHHDEQASAGSRADAAPDNDNDGDGWIEDIAEGSTTILHQAPRKKDIPEEEHRAIQLGMFDPGHEIDWHIAPCYFKACHTCRPFLEERSYIDLDAVVNGTGPLSSYPHACDFQERRVDDASCFRKPGDWIRLERWADTGLDDVFRRHLSGTGTSSSAAQAAETSIPSHFREGESSQTETEFDQIDVPFSQQWESMERRAQAGSSSTPHGQSHTRRTSHAPSAVSTAKPTWLEAMAHRWTQASAQAFRAVRRGKPSGNNLRGSYDMAAVQADLGGNDDGYESDDEHQTTLNKQQTARTKMKTISPEMYQSVLSGPMLSRVASAGEPSMSALDEDWDEDVPPPVPEHKYLCRERGNASAGVDRDDDHDLVSKANDPKPGRA